MQLHEELGDQVQCYTLNIDFIGGGAESPEDYREEVLNVLAEHGITVDNLLCSTPNAEVSLTLAPLSIPVVNVYDGAGQLCKQFHNGNQDFGLEGFSYHRDVIPFVRELLGDG